MVANPFETYDRKKLNLFFLPDGNERAKQTYLEGYGRGGNKVIEVVEALAERPDISEATFAILSKENIDLRSDDFLKQISLAFIGLGANIVQGKALAGRKVRLELSGDLNYLAAKSAVGRNLVDLARAVTEMTNDIKEPALLVKFAFAYPTTYLSEHGVDLVFRSGMESENTFRSSGLMLPEGVLSYGLPMLWPDIKNSEIMGIIREVRNGSGIGRFVEGYGEELLTQVLGSDHPRLNQLVFPSKRRLIEVKDYLMDQWLPEGNRSRTSVETSLNNDKLTVISRGQSQQNRIILVGDDIFNEAYLPKAKDYDALILPGQARGGFRVPSNLDIGYANLTGCNNTPDSIVATIRQAAMWSTKSPSLKGAQRVTVKNETREKDYAEAEKNRYRSLYAQLKGTDWPLELDEEVAKRAGFASVAQYYNHYGDLFVADQLKNGQSKNFPVDTQPQLNAFVNIALTVYFMCYYPHLQPMDSDWKRRAKGLSKYMMGIYLGDEDIFDVEIPGESLETRRGRLATVANYLKKGLRDGFRPNPIPKDLFPRSNVTTIDNIQKNFRELITESGADSNAWAMSMWQEDLAGFYDSCVNEWEHPGKFNYRADKLAQNVSLIAQSSRSIPKFFSQRFEEAGLKYRSEQSEQNLLMFQFYLHLLEVRRSIGAGLSFRTIALFIDEVKFSPEVKGLLDQTVFLNDLFYRVLNDISGLARAEDDNESTRDTLSLMKRYFQYESRSEKEALLKAVAFLKTFCDEVEQKLNTSRALLIEKLPELGIPNERAKIATVIYKNGHYRTVDRQMVGRFMGDMLDCGRTTLK